MPPNPKILESQLRSKTKENLELKRKLEILQAKSDFESSSKKQFDLQLKSLNTQLEVLTKSISDKDKKIARLTQDNEKLLKKKQSSPYVVQVEQVPKYLKNIIGSFEKNLKTDDSSSVDYVIGEMDFELKTHLLSDGKGHPMISTSDPSDLEVNKDSLSTIKFSVKPIPKESKK